MTFEHNSQAISPHHARAFGPRAGVVARIHSPVTMGVAEAVVMSWLCPANFLQEGALIRVDLFGNFDSGSTADWPLMWVRIGPHTLTGQTIAGVNPHGIDSQTAQSVRVEALITVVKAGSAGYCRGGATMYLGVGADDPDAVTSLSANTPDGPIDFTIANLIEVTFFAQPVGDPYTFWVGSIEIVSTGG